MAALLRVAHTSIEILLTFLMPPLQGRWRDGGTTEGLKQITAKFFTKPLSQLR